MIAMQPQQLDGQAILAAANEIEAAERRLLEHIITAAGRGDCEAIASVCEAWLVEPPVEVVKALNDAKPSR